MKLKEGDDKKTKALEKRREKQKEKYTIVTRGNRNIKEI